ncbi:transcriptional regulator [Paenibacillus zeisoli]|uniref:Transcriptional regulator n=1 Tax=Paenibacillus zeisoli TaxID=2496267 RepID=A0A433XR87_9BACL|nr:metalloregulator ArsR/SmtB family transcription factor [Paenibacillus zeisoli]RUT36468.1 transcriptional regulator [Paenibacillus zeisoli]
MDYLTIFKALANETRLQILLWLKEPEMNFPSAVPLADEHDFKDAICVGKIQEKAGMSQSTTSQYLSLLQRSGLLEARRIGQWTYYRRNEDTIQQLAKYIGKEL